MGDIGPFAVIALVWWVFSMLGEARKRQQGKGQPPVPRPRPQLPTSRSPAGDGLQQGRTRLEELLREYMQAHEPVASPPAPKPLPKGSWDTGVEEVEEREALTDYRPQIASHDGFENFERPEREVVVLGGDPEELQRTRMQYAEVRSQALTVADHQRFDVAVRSPHQVAQVTRKAPASEQMLRLRQAMIWREVLGPPVALRGEEWY